MSPVGARVFQFAIGLASVVLGFALARRYGDLATGLVCAALMATSWNLIFFEGELLDSVLLAAADARDLSCWCGAAGERGGAPGNPRAGFDRSASPSSVRTAGPASRRSALLAPLGETAPARTTSRCVEAPLLGSCSARSSRSSPATIRNQAVSGEWIPISANGGINLFIGNNPGPTAFTRAIPDVESLAGIRGWTCFDYPLVVKGLSREVGRP